MYGGADGRRPMVEVVYAHLTAFDDAVDLRDSGLYGGFPKVLPNSVLDRLLIFLQKAGHLAKLMLTPF